ncbi:MAG TPA: prepilin-type N-terminal cleavage/methylation domain-containing protein [Bacillota bacterium]|nr:prepilin-type N-terminal cleavage/methylation domain-containing protein [Bacillota bacterium]
MKKPRNIAEAGYTLIELLLYIAIFGVVALAATTFFTVVTTARAKNQSIAEVNDQGAALMASLTQTIHNATSITTPAAGASSPSLTLAVPTSSLSPTIFDASGTVLGLNADAGSSDTDDSNFINATKIVASATGTISALNAYVATVAASPNNKAQMAIYSGTTPTTLLASSASVSLTPNAWNSFPISTVNVTSGTTYWLAYNTNGLVTADNGMRVRSGAAGQSVFVAQTYGTWPGSFTGTAQALEFSQYAMIDPVNTPGMLRIKEGAAAAINLTDDHVQVSGLSFRNLTRSGTPGLVQITFTLSRVNLNNRNEYDYQKTFKTSAEVGW